MLVERKRSPVVCLAQLALLTAIVLVLQMPAMIIPIPFLSTKLSLVLIPIALGAMLLGPLEGAWLGFVFGLCVYIVGGVMGTDPFTAFLFQANPWATALICLGKSTLAGFLSGAVYRLLRGRREFLAVLAAAAAVPLVNTGLFLLGSLMILNVIRDFLGSIDADASARGALSFLFIGCAGVNFLFEFTVNMVLAPTLQRLIRLLSKRIGGS